MLKSLVNLGNKLLDIIFKRSKDGEKQQDIEIKKIDVFSKVLAFIFIGVFLDIIKAMNIVPVADNLFMGIIMMLIGIIISAIATVLYLGAGLGSGPRDGLMLALNKKTSKPVGVLRTCIELTALVCGWFLGGNVGIGTVISAFGLGYAIQIGFKICNINSKEIKHRIITDDIRDLKEFLQKRKGINLQEECVTEESQNK